MHLSLVCPIFWRVCYQLTVTALCCEDGTLALVTLCPICANRWSAASAYPSDGQAHAATGTPARTSCQRSFDISSFSRTCEQYLVLHFLQHLLAPGVAHFAHFASVSSAAATRRLSISANCATVHGKLYADRGRRLQSMPDNWQQ